MAAESASRAKNNRAFMVLLLNGSWKSQMIQRYHSSGPTYMMRLIQTRGSHEIPYSFYSHHRRFDFRISFAEPPLANSAPELCRIGSMWRLPRFHLPAVGHASNGQ